MQLYHDTDEWVTTHESRTCPFHREHPGESFAGCTCASSFGLRRATPEERAENKRKRLATAKAYHERMLREIEAQMGRDVRQAVEDAVLNKQLMLQVTEGDFEFFP